MEIKTKNRTRFSPSPTGELHIGGIRTALFSWLYAKHLKGEFILRIEDTDQNRSRKTSTRSIIQSMKWLGLHYDFGPFYQSERLSVYRNACEILLQNGYAYRCYCSKKRIDSLRIAQHEAKRKPRYDQACRNVKSFFEHKPYVVRLRNPKDGTTSFVDKIRGFSKVSNCELDDLVLVRSDGVPTYHFTVVVDDWKMNITDIIRGDDHISSTFRQINILKALGAQEPNYIHVSTVLGHDEKKLSKRHGALSMMQYRKIGYFPESIINYLIKLGWSNGNKEIFTLEEAISLFDIKGLRKSPSILDNGKLDWFNQFYFKNSSINRILDFLRQELRDKNFDKKKLKRGIKSIAENQIEREKNIRDIMSKSSYLFVCSIRYNLNTLKNILKKDLFSNLYDLLREMEKSRYWDSVVIKNAITVFAKNTNTQKGVVINFIRIALVGIPNSLPIINTLQIIGKNQTIVRLNNFLNFVDKKIKIA